MAGSWLSWQAWRDEYKTYYWRWYWCWPSMADAALRIASSLERCGRTQPKDEGPVQPKRRWLLKGKFLMVLALGIGVSILSLPLFAHHGNAVYDYTATKTVKGTVTEWTWANPHCFLWLDSKDENGITTHWV